ncbi:hydrophobic surface binding protein A-domain-containing protein [Aspergillus leporis]|jgi:hypothetical protein|uniref:Cell wall mannoprotein 1 n=1 Tax=Aspergillus leporis TaxID=41062 RepID=A0A5N5X537_9EURO|nr:hydrophobic surface binding protein A-domain-containing protein [Aspergillus leporis]
MKFSSILALGLASGALAAPTKVAHEPSIVERDLASVTNVLSGINTKVETLDSAIKGFSGGNTDSVVSASTDLVSAIKSGTETVKSSDALSSGDALGLPGPVQNLAKKIDTTIEDLISKKSQIVAAGAGAKTYKQVQDQYSAAKDLADTITSKVPDSLQGIAGQLSGGITAAIQKGLDAYKDASTSTGATSPTTSADSSAASSKPSSAPAAPPKPAAPVVGACAA